MTSFGWWNMAILAFVVTAAIADLRWRRIPRWLSVIATIAGIGYAALNGHVWPALAAAGLGLTAGLALFQIGAIGGGDVKLIAALGALLAFPRWVFAMEIAIIAAAVMALVQATARGALRSLLSNMCELVRGFASTGVQEHPEINVRNPAMLRAPFGVAAALGTIAALWLR